ncbi:hypothetical protein B4119_4134 [Parageobacillus caldoxylosilyticus]|uniref:Uncharacterized protein n=1 Tax=Saccharococcus caldoxylosilyticus TaxID=81408 RepID=A0A150LLX6_9BACL|nr:hypothetical protein B4119_4134 [Parageobacillus caldoxylosilyticus]
MKFPRILNDEFDIFAFFIGYDDAISLGQVFRKAFIRERRKVERFQRIL